MPQSTEEWRDTDCATGKSGLKSHFTCNRRLVNVQAHLFEERLDDHVLLLHLCEEVFAFADR